MKVILVHHNSGEVTLYNRSRGVIFASGWSHNDPVAVATDYARRNGHEIVKHGGKRNGAGRKPSSEPKTRTTVYLSKSTRAKLKAINANISKAIEIAVDRTD